LERVAGIEPA